MSVRAWITTDPIEPAELLMQAGDAADGATVLFLGHVREVNDGRPVTGMRYDAYVEMAERVLAEIAAEAMVRLGTERLAVVHRVGELRVGEVSVAIAASSAHRAEAFEVARAVIEEIKRRLPVWKEERYADGRVEWLPGHVPARPSEPAPIDVAPRDEVGRRRSGVKQDATRPPRRARRSREA